MYPLYGVRMDVRPEEIATRQDGVVARWQLRHAGMSLRAIEAWSHGLRVLHAGVYLTGWGGVTQRQRWWAAAVTAPGTVLGQASAAAVYEIRQNPSAGETVIRVGCRGRHSEPGLLVSYSLTLAGHIRDVRGLPATTVERTLIDLWPHLPPDARSRMLRESLRLRRTDPARLLAALQVHRGRRGVASLRAEVLELAGLQLERCLSDAEAFAVALLHASRVPRPEVNVRIGGRRADLSWPELRLIIEIDGPSFHVLRDKDIENTRRWEAVGYVVRRVPSDVLYADPAAVLRLAPPPAGRTSISTPQRG